MAVSCTSSDKWYLGEWEGPNGIGFTLTSTSMRWGDGPEEQVVYRFDELGRVWVDPADPNDPEWEGSGYLYGDPKTNKFYSEDVAYEDDEPVTCEYNRRKASTTKSSEDLKTAKKTGNNSKNSDKVWKSAFEENGGFLVFESLLTYSRGSYSTPTHLYIVLKGYGESRQKGMANVFLDGWAGWIGLYEMFDNVVMLYDLREEGKRGGREYSKPYTPLTSQFFTWENTTPITITGNFENYSEKVTWKQISNDIAKYLSRDETFNR